MNKRISLIVINIGGEHELRSCIKSLVDISKDGNPFELIVVNNQPGTSANSAKKAFSKAIVLDNMVDNYAKALNEGLRASKGDYIGIVCSTITIDKNWLKCLIEVMKKNDDLGIVQGKVLTGDGARVLCAGIEEYKHFYYKNVVGEGKACPGDPLNELNYFSACSFMLRRGCWKEVGDFDEAFINQLEDIDYSIRCRKLGWKLSLSSRSLGYCRHADQESQEVNDYRYFRSRLLLIGKHYPQRLLPIIVNSRFYACQNLEILHSSLIQALKVIAESKDTPLTIAIIDELRDILVEVLGPRKTYSFFSQLQLALGLRKLSICIYDHAFNFAGGGQRYAAKMAEMLQDRYDITYICNNEVSLDKYREWFDIDLSRCKLKIIKIPFYEATNSTYIDEGLALGEDYNPFDIIGKESIHYDVFINANMLSKVKPQSKYSIFFCHFPNRDIERFFSVDKYDCIVTNSDYGTFWLEQKWGLKATCKLYPPVDMFGIKGTSSSKEKIILSVARFELGGSKKQIEMAKAFSDLCKTDPVIASNWKLILAGGSLPYNPYLEKVREMVDSASGCNIELSPNLTHDELKSLYGKASIFWHACGLGEIDPHLIEHFGMTTVEAMQNYCVPIVIDGGGQKEIVVHGVCGYRFKTLKDLELYTMKVIKDDLLRTDLSKKAYEQSCHFTPQIFKDRIMRLFTGIENKLKGSEPVSTVVDLNGTPASITVPK